eukprot:GILK01011048.1.p1 GENE.GILK01011048.1~~GILK01011048.1.p1  ORF type:complete len:812 (-),score=128.27 GILK01011048.1:190-2625(-)
MGIAKYTKWIQKTFPAAYDKTQTESRFLLFDHLHIDVNALIHNSVRTASNDRHFVRNLFVRLDSILRAVRARKSITLALDGPAPFAKVLTQRKHRSAVRVEPGSLSTLAITPGTHFMTRLKGVLEYYAALKMETMYAKYNVSFLVSGADAIGEGEAKLFERIASSPVDNQTHIVIGDDADLILFALSSPKSHLFVMSATDSAANRFHSKSTVPLSYFSKQSFLKELESMFPNQSESVRLDFVVTSLLLGNDYLPKLSSTKLWDRYLKLRRNKYRDAFLIEQGTFNHKFMSDLLGQIHDPRPRRRSSSVDSSVTSTDNGGEHEGEDDPAYESDDQAEGNEADEDDQDDELVSSVRIAGSYDCKTYFEGILWILNMYMTGHCPDYRWFYRYRHAPLPSAASQFFAELDQPLQCPQSNSLPLTPLQCALALLPATATEILPVSLHPLLGEHGPMHSLHLSENCEACANFSKQMSRLNMEMIVLCKSIKSATDTETVEPLKQQRFSLRTLIATHHRSWRQHKMASHNMKTIDPVPFELVEAAVNQLPRETLHELDHCSVQFGRAKQFFKIAYKPNAQLASWIIPPEHSTRGPLQKQPYFVELARNRPVAASFPERITTRLVPETRNPPVPFGGVAPVQRRTYSTSSSVSSRSSARVEDKRERVTKMVQVSTVAESTDQINSLSSQVSELFITDKRPSTTSTQIGNHVAPSESTASVHEWVQSESLLTPNCLRSEAQAKPLRHAPRPFSSSSNHAVVYKPSTTWRPKNCTMLPAAVPQPPPQSMEHLDSAQFSETLLTPSVAAFFSLASRSGTGFP